jgi:dTMP kinase
MKRTDAGNLIAVEGIDGAGKTTQVSLLADALAAAGMTVVRSKEPTDGPWGKKIRESAATGRMTLEEEIQAFVEDRKEHVRNVILPALSQGKVVILDRYLYSTLAYQGARGGDMGRLSSQMFAIAPEPDIVLLLDVPPEVGLARISEGRGETPNAFEKLEDLKAVRDVFLRLAQQHKNMVRLDGSQSIEAVHRTILRVVLERVFKDHAKP